MLARSLIGLLLLAAAAQAEDLEQAIHGYLAAADAEGKGATSPWEIEVNLGITVAGGNSDFVTATAGGKAKRNFGKDWKLSSVLTIVYSEADGTETANEWILVTRLERVLSEKASVFVELLLEHDEQERLNYRIQGMGGYRRRLIHKESHTLFGEIGGGVRHDEFRVDPTTQPFLYLGVDFKWQITKQLLYEQIIRLFPSLSEFGEYRFTWLSTFTTPIGDRWDLRLTVLDQFNSDPVGGVKENDIQVTLALVFTFNKKKE